MVGVAYALYPWMSNHLVEVTETTTMPATERYHADRCEWLMRYEITNHGI